MVSYRAFENNTWGNETEVKVLEPGRVARLLGLRDFTKYEIKVAAATNYTGNYSQPINVTTREGGEVNTFHGGRVQLLRKLFYDSFMGMTKSHIPGYKHSNLLTG